MKFLKGNCYVFVMGAVFLAFTIAINLPFYVEVSAARNITSAQAEQIALHNLGVGEVIQNRIGMYHGIQVHQIRINYLGESFRIFVDMQGNIVRGNVGITILEAIDIATEQIGDENILRVRFTRFDGSDAYNILTDNFRIIIDSATGEILRIRAN
ncbi:MAG: PepSY domain-containing protein [Defluviitaleaceae bacterium]|nr:PepSY domain-containing protein [Defluviitaleaceae bacterium]